MAELDITNPTPITERSQRAGFYNTSIVGNDTTPAINRNRTVPLSFPGREVFLGWEKPGMKIGYDNSHLRSQQVRGLDFAAEHYLHRPYRCEWTGKTIQPDGRVFGDNTAPIVNGTMFVTSRMRMFLLHPST